MPAPCNSTRATACQPGKINTGRPASQGPRRRAPPREGRGRTSNHAAFSRRVRFPGRSARARSATGDSRRGASRASRASALQSGPIVRRQWAGLALGSPGNSPGLPNGAGPTIFSYRSETVTLGLGSPRRKGPGSMPRSRPPHVAAWRCGRFCWPTRGAAGERQGATPRAPQDYPRASQ